MGKYVNREAHGVRLRYTENMASQAVRVRPGQVIEVSGPAEEAAKQNELLHKATKKDQDHWDELKVQLGGADGETFSPQRTNELGISEALEAVRRDSVAVPLQDDHLDPQASVIDSTSARDALAQPNALVGDTVSVPEIERRQAEARQAVADKVADNKVARGANKSAAKAEAEAIAAPSPEEIAEQSSQDTPSRETIKPSKAKSEEK